MKRTIILSGRQINEVLGANSAYLDNAGVSDFRESPDKEVSADGKMSSEDGEPTVGDDVAQVMTSRDSFWTTKPGPGSRAPLVSLTCGADRKKKLSESNSQLEGRFFTVDPTTMRALKSSYSNSRSAEDVPGKQTLANVIERGGMTYTDATSIKSRMDKLPRDCSEYLEMGGRNMHRFVNMVLSTETGSIRRNKAYRAARGEENVYQKPGGRRESGNGKGHSPKNPGITYR